jgi:hypothetical protein
MSKNKREARISRNSENGKTKSDRSDYESQRLESRMWRSAGLV